MLTTICFENGTGSLAVAHAGAARAFAGRALKATRRRGRSDILANARRFVLSLGLIHAPALLERNVLGRDVAAANRNGLAVFGHWHAAGAVEE